VGSIPTTPTKVSCTIWGETKDRNGKRSSKLHLLSINLKNSTMKTHRITVSEEDWKESKYRTREWERRVNIVKWEHNYEDKMYYIDIAVKEKKK
jgi:hypothetical protein